jgi:hypothetical protein
MTIKIRAFFDSIGPKRTFGGEQWMWQNSTTAGSHDQGRGRAVIIGRVKLVVECRREKPPGETRE